MPKTRKALSPDAELKKKRKAMAEELYAAIRAGDDRKVRKLGNEIDDENRTGRGARVPVTTRSINAALQAAPAKDKDLLRMSLRGIAHLHQRGGCWDMGKTRRRRGSRKNGFLSRLF
jgi:hypothetical protein